jgi:hypothetical protein
MIIEKLTMFLKNQHIGKCTSNPLQVKCSESDLDITEAENVLRAVARW